MDESAAEPFRNSVPEGMSEWMVVVARPDADALATYDRGQKYRLLQENTATRREALITWLSSQGLMDQVANVGDPTAFNLLFVTATPAAGQRLADAPGVLSVSQVGDIGLELPKLVPEPPEAAPATKPRKRTATRKNRTK